jgi:putative colanic acid biosynthesis glycosyltransferase WcaI
MISQVYLPDPVRTGQLVHDVAVEMIDRGYRVIVYSAASGYDNPGEKFAIREELDGVEVRRFRFSSFGKRSFAIRLLAQSLFLVQCLTAGVMVRRLDVVLVSNSPPFVPLVGVWIARIRGAAFKWWPMDLNPDQLIALGIVSPTGLVAKVFDWVNRVALRAAAVVIPMDRFMADRLNAKLDVSDRTVVIPPWPNEYEAGSIAHADNPFRRRHGLVAEGRQSPLVIMYSGNHSLSNPLTTLIEAAMLLADRDDILFYFIGAGVEKVRVEQAVTAGATNIRSLPFQPSDQLKFSLSAADVHVVSVGDGIVGICHPCKVYGALAVARPVLIIGPPTCHASEIIGERNIGWHVQHGDVEGMVDAIIAMAEMPRESLRSMGSDAQELVIERYSRSVLLRRFCEAVQGGRSTFPPLST